MNRLSEKKKKDKIYYTGKNWIYKLISLRLIPDDILTKIASVRIEIFIIFTLFNIICLVVLNKSITFAYIK